MSQYITCTELRRLTLPRSVSLAEFEPGIVSEPLSFTGTGDGTLEGSWPLDGYSAKVRISKAGELGTARARLSVDGGLTWGPSWPIPASGEVETPGKELVLRFGDGGVATPTYALGDTWTFTTTPSPELLAAIRAASDEADGYLGATLSLVLTSWSEALKLHVAGLARWTLMSTRGFDPKSSGDQLYRLGRTDALRWLEQVAVGQIKPVGLAETGSGISFPDQAPVAQKYAQDYPL